MIDLDENRRELEELNNRYLSLESTIGKKEELEKKLKELEEKTIADGFWNDTKKANLVLRDIKEVKSKYTGIVSIEKDLENLTETNEFLRLENDEEMANDLIRSTARLKGTIENLETKMFLSGKFDRNNAIITLHPGAGGTESQDWAEMLYRMYSRWAASHNYTVKEIDFLEGEEAGIKSVTAVIEGEYAYGYLKGEMGVHRLVRISPFDAGGRRHTSFASLEVLPEITDDVELEINQEDLRIDTYRSSGAGGQHVNKTSSAVRITHIPTNIVTSCQSERSQLQNKETALKMLKSKLLDLKEKEHKDKIEDLKGVQREIAWGSQIRSYVFCPYTLVKDHRTNFEVGNVEAVMNGDLDKFMEAYLKNNI